MPRKAPALIDGGAVREIIFCVRAVKLLLAVQVGKTAG
jgi:hypothetical protein